MKPRTVDDWIEYVLGRCSSWAFGGGSRGRDACQPWIFKSGKALAFDCVGPLIWIVRDAHDAKFGKIKWTRVIAGDVVSLPGATLEDAVESCERFLRRYRPEIVMVGELRKAGVHARLTIADFDHESALEGDGRPERADARISVPLESARAILEDFES